MVIEFGLLLGLALGSQQEVDSEAPEEPVAPKSSSVMEKPNQYIPYTTVVPPPPGSEYFYGDWPFGSDGITGDWGGLRTDLEQRGVFLQGQYTSILTENFTGGLDTGFFGAGALELMLTINTEQFIGLPGGTFFANYGYSNWLNSRFEPSGQYNPTGSWVGSNGNFPPGDSSTLNQLTQLFWSQSLFDDKFNITFGKIDGNIVFSSISGAGGFIYSTASYPSTVEAYFPSYPQEATGLQLSLDINDHLSGHFGWFDGTTAAFDPATGAVGPSTGSSGFGSFFDNSGHWFFITQMNADWQIDPTTPGQMAIGGWLQSGTTATAGNSTTGVDDPAGFYIQASQTIFASSETSASEGGGIELFTSIGWAPASKSAVEWSLTSGMSATGVIPTRPADALGIMGAVSWYSDDPAVYLSRRKDGTRGPSGGIETMIELFYRVQLTPALWVQPGFQWIGNPGGGNPAQLDDAVQGYLMVNIQF